MVQRVQFPRKPKILSGMNRLIELTSSINPSFVDLVELLTLLTTQLENLHAVSHFKHETFQRYKE